MNINFDWFLAAIVRAIKTFAQTAVGMIAVGAALYEINWGHILSVSFVAAILSILTSVAGLPEVSYDGDLLIDTSGKGDPYKLNINDDFDDFFSKLENKNRIVLRIDHKSKSNVEDDMNPKD